MVSTVEISMLGVVKHQTMRITYQTNHLRIIISATSYKLCQPDIFSSIKLLLQYSHNTSSIFCYCRTIIFYATTDKIRFTMGMGQTRLGGLYLMYILNDISISTGAIVKKIAATRRKINFNFLQHFYVATTIL